MSASLENRISPHVSPNTKSLLDTSAFKPENTSGGEKIDFKDLLIESNTRATEQRSKADPNKLDSAESYEQFIEALNQKQDRRAPKNEMSKDDFLTLFVTQLQNQDPLNPKDGAEMAAQLAQFNSLEQMLNMNTSLQDLASQVKSQHNLQFVDFIGKDIDTTQAKVKLTGGQINPVKIFIPRDANQVNVSIVDGAGQVKGIVGLGSLNAGDHTFDWDGKLEDETALPDGVYSFKIEALDKNESKIDLSVTSRLSIDGVDVNSSEGIFHTKVGPIKFKDLKSIYQASDGKTTANQQNRS